MQQAWDKNGRIYYIDDNGNRVQPKNTLNAFQKLQRQAKAKLGNLQRWLENSDAGSQSYKDKANLVFNIETLLAPALKGSNSLKNANRIPTTQELLDEFYNINSKILNNAPEIYTGERNVKSVIEHLGGAGNSAAITTPIDTVILNNKNLPHLLYDNEPSRLKFLNHIKNTFENPNFIIKGSKDNNLYKYYGKSFKKDNNKIQGFLGITRDKGNIGNFYQTSSPVRKSKLKNLLNEGQVIYDNLPGTTAPAPNGTPVNNIINDFKTNFNPKNTKLFENIVNYFKDNQ